MPQLSSSVDDAVLETLAQLRAVLPGLAAENEEQSTEQRDASLLRRILDASPSTCEELASEACGRVSALSQRSRAGSRAAHALDLLRSVSPARGGASSASSPVHGLLSGGAAGGVAGGVVSGAGGARALPSLKPRPLRASPAPPPRPPAPTPSAQPPPWRAALTPSPSPGGPSFQGWPGARERRHTAPHAALHAARPASRASEPHSAPGVAPERPSEGAGAADGGADARAGSPAPARELCIRLGADGTACVFDAADGAARTFSDALLFEVRLRGMGVTVTSLRYNAAAAPTAHAQRVPAPGAPHFAQALPGAAAAPAPLLPTWFAACASEGEENEGPGSPGLGARRSTRVRALFDNALLGVLSDAPSRPASSLSAKAAPAASLDLSARATLRHIAAGRLGDALLEAASPQRAAPRPLPRELL